jgi:hypothetical protein
MSKCEFVTKPHNAGIGLFGIELQICRAHRPLCPRADRRRDSSTEQLDRKRERDSLHRISYRRREINR